MNDQINAIQARLDQVKGDASAIEMELQAEWFKVFEASEEIRDAVSKVEMSNEYQHNTFGEICQYVYCDLSEFPAEFLREYLRDAHCVDLDGECLSMSQGDDCLVIQDDTRYGRDNGLWQSSKRVIDEVDYKDDDGEIDEAKRNALIEKHMERTGFYPGVYRVDSNGNIFPVKTN